MRLLIESLRLIRTNIEGVLTRLLPAWAFWVLLVVLLERALSDVRPMDGGPVMTFGEVALWGLVTALGGAALAVMWHRMAMQADAGVTPLRGYLRYLAALGLLVLLSMIYLVLANASLATLVMMGAEFSRLGFLVAYVLIPALTTALLTWGWLRLGLILPAAAVSEGRFTLRASWAATRRWTWQIVVFSVAVAVAQMILGRIGGALTELAGSAALSLLGLSALTWMFREAAPR